MTSTYYNMNTVLTSLRTEGMLIFFDILKERLFPTGFMSDTSSLVSVSVE